MTGDMGHPEPFPNGPRNRFELSTLRQEKASRRVWGFCHPETATKVSPWRRAASAFRPRAVATRSLPNDCCPCAPAAPAERTLCSPELSDSAYAARCRVFALKTRGIPGGEHALQWPRSPRRLKGASFLTAGGGGQGGPLTAAPWVTAGTLLWVLEPGLSRAERVPPPGRCLRNLPAPKHPP